ncbi:MAG: hypothetical protein KY467_15825 [Gemmatimonadetes bacterium]|nr:hypothetical protein [Gemmatimonadota bacterium]
MNKLRLNLEELSVESFTSAESERKAETQREFFASDLRSCWDTECGRDTYCASSPCAC